MKRARRTREYTVSSGNVFRDLGLPNPDEELTKSSLLLEIYRTIRARGLKQVEAARILGIPQPKVSNLLRGQPEGFSVERLALLLGRLGRRVTLVVSDQEPPPGQARIPVVRDPGGLIDRMTRVQPATDERPARRYSAPRKRADSHSRRSAGRTPRKPGRR